jgi:ankyrin repeat protein
MKQNSIYKSNINYAVNFSILLLFIFFLSAKSIFALTLQDFYDAVSYNKYETVKEYLKTNRIDINKVAKSGSCQGVTPLQCAGSLEIIKLLIDNGADYKKRIGDYTALEFFATKKDGGEAAFYLLGKGAKPSGFALYNALWYENTELAEKFLELGVDPNYVDKYLGYSPLIIAAQNGYSLNLIKKLVKAGANVKFVTTDEKLSVLNFYPRKRSIAHRGHVGEMSELNISIKESLDKIAFFIEKGANINHKSKYGFTSLMMASQSMEEAAFLLIEKGANLNIRSKTKDTLLHMAASGGFPRLVEYYIKKGVKVNARNRKRETAILNAAGTGNYKVIKILIDNGANCKLLDRKRTSPLHRISIWPTARSHYSYLETNEEDFYKGLELILSKSGRVMIHKRNRYNETPWFNLVGWMGPLPQKIKLFLKYGANKNVRDKETRKTLKQLLKKTYNKKSKNMNVLWKKMFTESIQLLK